MKVKTKYWVYEYDKKEYYKTYMKKRRYQEYYETFLKSNLSWRSIDESLIFTIEDLTYIQQINNLIPNNNNNG